MSVQALSWAWDQPVKGNTKLVLLALADHADDNGHCFPHIKSIAKMAGIGLRTAQRKIDELETEGYLVRERVRRRNGNLAGYVYHLRVQRDGSEPLESPPDNLTGGTTRQFDGSPPDNLTGRPPANLAGPNEPSTTEPSTGKHTSHAPACAREDFPDWFEEIWAACPERIGANPKLGAFRAANARIEHDGATPESLLQASLAYAEFVRVLGVNRQYVMQLKSFFGLEKRGFEEDWRGKLRAYRKQEGPQDRGFAEKDYRNGATPPDEIQIG